MATGKHRSAAWANAQAYDAEGTRRYIDRAPHLKHASLKRLYLDMVAEVFDGAASHVAVPRILDLGAGEGSATIAFLELGAQVTAVDISAEQLSALRSKTAVFGMLETRCEDVFDALRSIAAQKVPYDVVVSNSFLHHIPDYLSLIRESACVLAPHGQFFSFQDPLRYDSLRRPVMLFSTAAYFCWRITRGDVVRGVGRRIRRRKGIYLESCVEDNAEYHVTRGGVDQDAINVLLEELGFTCMITRYFSTQGRMWQAIGDALGVANTFAVLAKRSGRIMR